MPTRKIGALIAHGRTSDVYEFGLDSVVKVPRPDVPDHWAEREALLTAAVYQCGVTTPVVRGMESINGRSSVVFERITGPSMWDLMLSDPSQAGALARQMAEIQNSIHSEPAPDALPNRVERVRGSLDEVVHKLPIDERSEVGAILNGLPRGSLLCHGDLHPGNILMSPTGPVIIDWFDAASGTPVADLVRTSLLIRPSMDPLDPPLHLNGASDELLHLVHAEYLAKAFETYDGEISQVRQWEAVLALSRIAEEAQIDDSALLALWHDRESGPGSVLVEVLLRLGVGGDD